jgi:hypothetical protein
MDPLVDNTRLFPSEDFANSCKLHESFCFVFLILDRVLTCLSMDLFWKHSKLFSLPGIDALWPQYLNS